MKRSSGARIGATFAVTALSLALITGCGGDSDDDNKGAAADSTPTQAAKVFSAAELKKLIIAKGDLDGYDVESADTGDQFAASKDKVTVADAKCEPLAYVLTGFAPGDDETGYVNRMVTETADLDATPDANASEEDVSDALESITDSLGSTMTIVSLSSYESDGAEQTMKAVTDAVGGCASGFTVAATGQDTQKFTKVAEDKSTATGDESVAFAVTGDVDGGDETTVHAEVVRHGSTIATYYSISLAALAGKATDYSVPAELVKAQAAKLK